MLDLVCPAQALQLITYILAFFISRNHEITQQVKESCELLSAHSEHYKVLGTEVVQVRTISSVLVQEPLTLSKS